MKSNYPARFEKWKVPLVSGFRESRPGGCSEPRKCHLSMTFSLRAGSRPRLCLSDATTTPAAKRPRGPRRGGRTWGNWCTIVPRAQGSVLIGRPAWARRKGVMVKASDGGLAREEEPLTGQSHKAVLRWRPEQRALWSPHSTASFTLFFYPDAPPAPPPPPISGSFDNLTLSVRFKHSQSTNLSFWWDFLSLFVLFCCFCHAECVKCWQS